MHLHDKGRGFVDCKAGLKHVVDHMDPEMKTTFFFKYLYVGVAPIMQLRKCVMKIVTFKRGHLMFSGS